jgi:hypothetical protein
MAIGIRIMNKYARIMCLGAAGLTIVSAAFAQDYTRLRPRSNQLGSAVCPDGYDYYRGWCRLRGNDWTAEERYRGRKEYGHRQREFGYEGRPLPPRWSGGGSAICPEDYDYFIESGLCMPRVESREPPSWNSQGSSMCPEFYDYYGGECIAREQVQREPELEPDYDDDRYGYGLGVPPQWNSRYCANYYDGGTNCGFQTWEQCQAAASGVGGFCQRGS